MSSEKKNRLQKLASIPELARMDHRNFLDQQGNPLIYRQLSRSARRELERKSKKIAQKYNGILYNIKNSGAGFPVDSLLRQLAVEYTHRFASSGTLTQPTSFNYFEPFLNINLIADSVAPYTDITQESDHLFNISDFFDFATSPTQGSFDLSSLMSLQDGKTFHFTTNGHVMDLRFLDGKNSEFVISGFSMIRRGRSLHWYLVGGEIFSESEWNELTKEQTEININDLSPHKRAFLAEMLESKKHCGAPVPLEGTQYTQRTVISGEIDLPTKKHISRCQMIEAENSFSVYCDDHSLFEDLPEDKITQMLSGLDKHMQSALVIWNLADSLFQLPNYFSHKISLKKDVLTKAGKKLDQPIKGGVGIDSKYKIIAAIEIENRPSTIIKSILLPHYQNEQYGYWRRLKTDQLGKDRDGREIKGKTWVNAQRKWQLANHSDNVVYVKECLGPAKLKISEYELAAEKVEKMVSASKSESLLGELYIMRCTVMNEQVYKVGWTSKDSQARADELSSATGVPQAFIVVKVWKHSNAEKLEKDVHMMLAPYRINPQREFFALPYEKLTNIIENILERANR